MMSLSTMNHWKSWSKNLMLEEPMLPSEYLTTLSTGGAAIHCGRLPLQPVVVVSNLWHWVPRVMTWPALGLK